MTTARDVERDELFANFLESRNTRDRDYLLASYTPLAHFFAGRYSKRGVDLEDLRQVAQLGLVAALDRFDPSLGVKFSTFAGRTIDGELKRYFRDKTWAVRVPRSLKEISIEVRKVASELTAETGKSPTVPDLVEATGHTSDVIIEALNVQSTGYRADSLEAPLGSSDGLTIGDGLASSRRDIETSDIQMAVQSMLGTLDERDRKILEMRFFDDRTQQEIADEVGLSQMHVSRILRDTLERLRAEIDS